MATPMDTSALTDEEAAVYDRQIRTWGLEAQKRMREASVLVVGLKGLGAEVCKNIVLAGIASLTIMDHELVSERDISTNFFLSSADFGKNRADACKNKIQELNPRVKVIADTADIRSKDESFFSQFNVVCLTTSTLDIQVRVNELCRKQSSPVAFFGSLVLGYYAFFFEDLQEFRYVVTEKDPENKTVGLSSEGKLVSHVAKFISLQEMLSCSWTQASKCMLGPSHIPSIRGVFISSSVLMLFEKKYGHLPSKSEESLLLDVANEYGAGATLPLRLLNDITVVANVEINPVCAVFGGLLGQEILKAVSAKDPPHNNMLLYNAIGGRSDVVCIHP